MMSVPPWIKRYPFLAGILVVALVIGALGTAAAVVDEYRWWVYKTEFRKRNVEVDGHFESVRSRVTRVESSQISLNIDVLRGQLWTVQGEIRALRAKNLPIPNSLYKEESRLKARIRDLGIRLAPRRIP